MRSYCFGGQQSASYFPLDSLDFDCCVAAYEWGRRNDRAFYTGAWAPEEHLVRATEGCEFRGLMVRQGLFGVPRKFGKYPPAVVIARQRGSRIERVFAPLPAEFLESAHLGATLAQIDIRPAEWFAAWSRKIGGRELILADEVEIGGLQ